MNDEVAGLTAALQRKTEMLEEVHGWLDDARQAQKLADALLNNKNLQIKILELSLSEHTGVPVGSIKEQVRMKIAEINKKNRPDHPQVLVATEKITDDNSEPTDGCSEG